MSYRLGVANIYELLSDDNGEAIAAVKANDQKKSEPAPAAKVQSKTATSSTSSSQQQSKPKPQTDRKNDRAQSNDGKGPQQKRERPPRLEGSSSDQGQVEDSERRRSRPEGARGPRGEGRGRREGGQTESNDGFRGPSNKRVFDRKSGTGRGREYNKKGGSGKGNWGTVSDDRVAQEEGAKEEETEETKETKETKVEAEKAPETQDAEKKDTEVKQEEKQPDPDEKLKTLDEYLKEVKKPSLGLPQPRKPGEGEKDASWANYVPLKREDESSQGSPKEERRNKEPKSSAVRVDIKFQQEERRGFGRGRGERSDRGQRKDRSGGRGPRQNNKQSAPNFQDESSFPALSTKA